MIVWRIYRDRRSPSFSSGGPFAQMLQWLIQPQLFNTTNRLIKNLVSDTASSALAPALNGAETWWSSGVYTATDDHQVSALGDLLPKCLCCSSEASILTQHIMKTKVCFRMQQLQLWLQHRMELKLCDRLTYIPRQTITKFQLWWTLRPNVTVAHPTPAF